MTITWNEGIAHTGRRPASPRRGPRSPTLTEFAGLARTAAPIAGVGITNLAITLTDLAMMAAYDRDALAAGAIIGDIFSIAVQFTTGALLAVVPAIARARAVGADLEIGQSICVGIRLATIIAVVGFVLIASITDILAWAGVTIPLKAVADTHAFYMASAFALMTIVALARTILPALGRGALGFTVVAAAVPLNAAGDLVFMHGYCGFPEMGLAGAGAASFAVAAFAATTLMANLILSPSMRPYQVLRGLFNVKPYVPVSLLRAASMTGAINFCETGIFLSSTAVVGAFAIADMPAHVAVFRALALLYMVASGFGQAVTIRIAAAGATGDLTRQAAVRRAAGLGVVVFGLAFFILIAAVPPSAAGLLAADAALAGTIGAIAPLAAVACSALVMTAVAFGLLRASADVGAPALISLFGYWGIGGSTMILLAGPLGLGVVGVWVGLAAGTTATAAGAWSYARIVKRV